MHEVGYPWVRSWPRTDMYKAKIKLNILDTRRALFDTKMGDFSSVSAHAVSIEEQVVAFNLGAAAGTTMMVVSTATTMACLCGRYDGMVDSEHAFILMNGVFRTGGWQVFLQIMRDKPDIQAIPSGVIEKFPARETGLMRENGLTPEASLTARRGAGRGRGKGVQAGADTADASREGRTYICQRKGHTSRDCYSRKRDSLRNPSLTATATRRTK